MNRNGAIIQLLQSGYLLGSRTVYTSGSSNQYTPPAGCKSLFVEVISAGGGSTTTANATAAQIALGAGGAGGAYASDFVNCAMQVSYGSAPYTANVGPGSGSGSAGSVSSFLSNAGASLGALSAVNIVANNGSFGGALATGTSEIFLIGGNVGSTSTQGALVTPGGNAGVNGHRVSGTVGLSGRGGMGPFGTGQSGARKAQGNGNNGGNYGAGASGGMSVNAGGAATSGTSGGGLIVIWEFY